MKCNDCDTEVDVPVSEQSNIPDGVLCYDCGIRHAWNEHGEFDF